MRAVRLGGILLALVLSFCFGTTSSASPSAEPYVAPVFDTILTYPGGTCGRVKSSSPTLADLDADGKQEIILGTTKNLSSEGGYAACLAVLNPSGTIRWSRQVSGAINSSAAVADINGDGFLDIVVGMGGDATPPLTPGGVVAFDRNGNQLWWYQTGDRIGVSGPDGMPDGVYASPAIVDLFHDGTRQIVAGAWDTRLHLIQGATGQAVAGSAGNPWPAEMLDTIWSSPAISDLDGDGRSDFVFGGDMSAYSPACTSNGGMLRAMYHLPGIGAAHTPGFEQVYGCLTGGLYDIGHHGKYVDQTIYSSPVIADFAGRGRSIVVGSGCAFPTGTNCSSAGNGKWVKVWSKSGELLATLATDAPVFSSPAVADINRDGELDIIATTMGSGWMDGTGLGGTIYVWSGTQGFPLLWTAKPKFTWGMPNVRIPSSPVVADLNADGRPEIVLGYLSEIVVFDNAGRQLTETTGAIRPGVPTLYLGRSTVDTSPAVGDLMGNGTLQIIGAGSWCDPSTGACDHKGRVRAWSASLFNAGTNPLVVSAPSIASPNWPQSGLAWPMFRREPTHQAFQATPGVPPTLGNRVYLPVIRR